LLVNFGFNVFVKSVLVNFALTSFTGVVIAIVFVARIADIVESLCPSVFCDGFGRNDM
jgi:hypothetical protein